jgi:hypothetical protein
LPTLQLKEYLENEHFARCEEILSSRRLLVTAGVVPSSSILVASMKEALSSSETLVLTRATRRNIPEDSILNTRILPQIIQGCFVPHNLLFIYGSIILAFCKILGFHGDDYEGCRLLGIDGVWLL